MNIYLTGMPGSGKSTLAKLLSQETGRELVDMDQRIEQAADCSISEIFQTYGESAFRIMETLFLHTLDDKGYIVSTGGGVPMKEENVDAMREKGVIVFIDRPLQHILEDIETQDRPLLAGGSKALCHLYERRIETYRKNCDNILDNTDTYQTLKKLMELIEE